MSAQRDLLFGLLALQNGLIEQVQLVAALESWTRDKARPLADHFARRGDLDPDQRACIEAMVALQLKKHGGDAGETLAAIPAGRSTRLRLAEAGDVELSRTVARVGSGSTEADADVDDSATYTVGAVTSDGQRFRVLRPHARGGLGAVFVALDGELHREVALKQILDQHADDPMSRQRFLLEAEITGGLEHPGIVPVYGLGTYADGRPYYAMRFIRGESLKQAVDRFHAEPVGWVERSEAHREAGRKARRKSDGKAHSKSDRNADRSVGLEDSTHPTSASEPGGDPGRRSLELRMLLRRFIDVCNAIHYAHSRGVIHRDIKPSNIIVGKYGETLVVDWGLAKPTGRSEVPGEERMLAPGVAGGSSETLPGSALGTPAYMSPEQARGELDRVGPRSDVYSLGATLYYVLCGKSPFEGNDAATVLRAVREGRFPPPRQADLSIDQALEAICLKAMSLAPVDRYPTARELAGDIERWMADEPVSARKEPARDRLARWGRRHRTLVAAAAVLLLSTVVALALGLYAVGREQRETRAQRDRAEGALAAETRARKRTRAALDEMSSRVIEDLMTRTAAPKLEPEQEEFLRKALDFYREFAAETGNDVEVRWGVAGAHRRIAAIQRKLSQLTAAEEAFSEALAIVDRLAAEFPGQPIYPRAQAEIHHEIATIDHDTSRPKDGETHERKALALLASLPEDIKADPDLIKSQAEFEMNLGRLLFDLGRLDDADNAMRVAVETARKAAAGSSSSRSRFTLALVLYTQADRTIRSGRDSNAEAPAREAIGLIRSLVQERPLDVQFRLFLASSLSALASSLGATGRSPDAETAFRECMAVFGQLATEFPGVPRYRSSLAVTYDLLAILMANQGKLAEAERYFRDEVALRRRLAADFPSEPAYPDELGSALNNLGVLLYTTGRIALAEESYREASTLLQRLAERFPEKPEYRDRSGVWKFNLALLLHASGQNRKAQASTREAIALQRPLVASQPGQARYRFHLAKSLELSASILRGENRVDEAESAAREVVTLLSQLAADFPKVVTYREEHGVALGSLARIIGMRGRTREAEPLHRDAVALLEKLVAEAPGNPTLRQELGTQRVHLASLFNRERRYQEARVLLQQSGRELEAAIKASPANKPFRKNVREQRAALAVSLVGLGEYRMALDEAGGIARLGWSPADDSYAAASALASCSAVAPRTATGKERGGESWAKTFAAAALEELSAAVAAGFVDIDRIARDEGFDGLRATVEFRATVMGLALPADPFAPEK
jgi:serine/threonine-protein kinase